MMDMVLEPTLWEEEEIDLVDEAAIVTEDDTPVDNIFSEKQQRLLTEPLYNSTAELGMLTDRPFFALANVGLFYAMKQPPLVPDMMLSLDVEAPQGDLWLKHNRSYFMWRFGKPPEVVIEIVSNRKGHEADEKLRDYARIGVIYYVIFDPQKVIQSELVQVYKLSGGIYRQMKPSRGRWPLSRVGLSLILWTGMFEDSVATWLRWANLSGKIISTGGERATSESKARHQAEAARQVAEQLAQSESEARRQAEVARRQAEVARRQAEAQALAEVQARQQAEARIAELEAKLRQLTGAA